MRADRSIITDVQSTLCYFPNNGHNHPSYAVKVIKTSTGGLSYTSDVIWTVHRAPATEVAVGSVYAAAPISPGFNISYVPPPPPIRSSELQPLPPSLQPSPPPLPPSQSSSLPPAVPRPRAHTEPERISGRTRSKTAQVSYMPTIHLVRHAERADVLAASSKRPGAPPRRQTPVDDEQDCADVDGD